MKLVPCATASEGPGGGGPGGTRGVVGSILFLGGVHDGLHQAGQAVDGKLFVGLGPAGGVPPCQGGGERGVKNGHII